MIPGPLGMNDYWPTWHEIIPGPLGMNDPSLHEWFLALLAEIIPGPLGMNDPSWHE
jgi:hypothetical protein